MPSGPDLGRVFSWEGVGGWSGLGVGEVEEAVLQREGRAISRQGRKKYKTKTHLSALSVLGIRQPMGRWMDRRTDGGESEHTAVLGRYQRRVKHRREPIFWRPFY